VSSFIAAEKTDYPVAVMCRVFGVNRTGFHSWERRAPSDRALRDAWLTEKIKQVHDASRGVYGAPRIHAVANQHVTERALHSVCACPAQAPTSPHLSPHPPRTGLRHASLNPSGRGFACRAAPTVGFQTAAGWGSAALPTASHAELSPLCM
jgi:hypothetical protein